MIPSCPRNAHQEFEALDVQGWGILFFMVQSLVCSLIVGVVACQREKLMSITFGNYLKTQHGKMLKTLG